MAERYDCLIVGGGPAGLTAAIYLRRAGKTCAIAECCSYGGQISSSHAVENFPAIESVSGIEFADRLYEQADKAGAQTLFTRIERIERDDDVFRVTSEDGEIVARSVIYAAGTKHRSLNLPEEERFIGRGISYCAVCDGAFYRDKDVAVIGGGNSALQAALYLTSVARKIYLIHRRDEYRAEQTLIDRVAANAKIERVVNAVAKNIVADGDAIEGLALEDTQSGARRAIDVKGVFVEIGQIPQNDLLKPLIPLDADGYVPSGEDCATPIAGLFVAGDCRAKSLRQLTTAVSDGAIAATAAGEYLDRLD